MAEIINLNKINQQKKDEDNGIFAIRKDDGDLKNLEDWNGEEWESLFQVFEAMAERMDISPWDIFADFMRSVLEE